MGFKLYGDTCSYSSRPFLCTLDMYIGKSPLGLDGLFFFFTLLFYSCILEIFYLFILFIMPIIPRLNTRHRAPNKFLLHTNCANIYLARWFMANCCHGTQQGVLPTATSKMHSFKIYGIWPIIDDIFTQQLAARSGSPQIRIHTHMRNAVSLASVGLTQARPNNYE